MWKKEKTKKARKKADAPMASDSVEDRGDENEKKAKRVNIDIAPRLYKLLKDRVEELNSSPDSVKRPATKADIVNEALDKFLGKQKVRAEEKN